MTADDALSPSRRNGEEAVTKRPRPCAIGAIGVAAQTSASDEGSMTTYHRRGKSEAETKRWRSGASWLPAERSFLTRRCRSEEEMKHGRSIRICAIRAARPCLIVDATIAKHRIILLAATATVISSWPPSDLLYHHLSREASVWQDTEG